METVSVLVAQLPRPEAFRKLSKLAECDENRIALRLAPGLMAKCVLAANSSKTREYAYELLHNLAASPENKVPIFNEPELVPNIVSAMLGQRTVYRGAGVLHQLSGASENVVPMHETPYLVHAAVEATKVGRYDTVMDGLGLILNLSTVDHDQFFFGVAPTVLRYVRCSNVHMKRLGISTMGNLSTYPHNCDSISLADFHDAAKHDDPIIREGAERVIRNVNWVHTKRKLTALAGYGGTAVILVSVCRRWF